MVAQMEVDQPVSILTEAFQGTYIPELESDATLCELVDIQSFEYTLQQATSAQTAECTPSTSVGAGMPVQYACALTARSHHMLRGSVSFPAGCAIHRLECTLHRCCDKADTSRPT